MVEACGGLLMFSSTASLVASAWKVGPGAESHLSTVIEGAPSYETRSSAAWMPSCRQLESKPMVTLEGTMPASDICGVDIEAL